jgi:N-dimethylarginine dimethylaminohydrolase
MEGTSAPASQMLPSETGQLTHVLLKHPREAFVDHRTIAAEWQPLNFTAPPDLGRATEEYERFVDILRSSGAVIHFLPRAAGTTLDSLYARDASIVCGRGIILCNMGKRSRSHEPDAQEAALRAIGAPYAAVAGRIDGAGRLEGGDVIWLDPRTIVVGRGYRTNDEGIRQLRALLGDSIDDLVVVPLPHWRGVADVMHLMSLISPVDSNLAVVYAPLLPVPFREYLLHRGIDLVEVPDEEFESMGTNVLALGRRRCLLLAGNPRTRRLLEAAGAEVVEYAGDEISVKGAGGPTCLTRPLARAPIR